MRLPGCELRAAYRRAPSPGRRSEEQGRRSEEGRRSDAQARRNRADHRREPSRADVEVDAEAGRQCGCVEYVVDRTNSERVRPSLEQRVGETRRDLLHVVSHEHGRRYVAGLPPQERRAHRRAASRPATSSPAVGSSSNTGPGLGHERARASSTRWRSPDDSVPNGRSARPRPPERDSSATARLRSSSSYSCHHGSSAACLAVITMSVAVIDGRNRSENPALATPTRRRSFRTSVRPSSSPSTVTVPAVGCR